MMSQAYNNDDARSTLSKGSRRQSTGGAYGRELEKPRRKPRNVDRMSMSAADLVFRNNSKQNTDTYKFSDDESDWVTDLEESESENEAPSVASSLSVLLKVVKPQIHKLIPDIYKVRPDVQKIGGTESDWFTDVTESEAESSSRPARSLLEKKKKRTAGQAKREAEAQANSEDFQTEKVVLKKKGKASSRKPVKVLKQTRGRASNRGEEVEDEVHERSASRSVSVQRRPENTRKRSKSAKRSSNRSLDGSIAPQKPVSETTKTPNSRGRASNRGEEVEDEVHERSASRSVSVQRRPENTRKRSKSAKRSSNRSLDGSIAPRKPVSESAKTPNTRGRASNRGEEVGDEVHERSASRSVSVQRRSGGKTSHGDEVRGRGRGRSPSQMSIVLDPEDDPEDDMDALIQEANEIKERKSILDKSRNIPFYERSVGVGRHGFRDRSRSRSVSRSRDGKGRNVADISLIDDREMARREESGMSGMMGYLPTALDRRKEHLNDDFPRAIKNGGDRSNLMIKTASGRLAKKPTDGRSSLDGMLDTPAHNAFSGSASLSGMSALRMMSDSASLGGDVRPNSASDKSRMLQVDSHNWGGAMDNLLEARRGQRPCTMESPHLHEPKVAMSAQNRGPGLSKPANWRPGESASRLDGGVQRGGPQSTMTVPMHGSAGPAPKTSGHMLGAVMSSVKLGGAVLSSVKASTQQANALFAGISGQSGRKYSTGSMDGNGNGNVPAAQSPPRQRKSNAPGHSHDFDRRRPASLGTSLHYSP